MALPSESGIHLDYGESRTLMAFRARKLLSVGHSYVVALNRRLANEMARVGEGKWEVTAVAPAFFQGDLRPIHLEFSPGEVCRLEPVRTYLARHKHIFFYGRRLRTILRMPWNLVHCWEEPYVIASGQVALWNDKDTPFVFWTAQNITKSYPPPFRGIERYSLDRCAGWMACGRSIVDTLLQRGYGRKPYRVMPLGVDPEQFRPDPAAGAQVRDQQGWRRVVEPPVIGFLGRFVEEKGVSLLMRALDGLPSKWRALFVGAGPAEENLRKWALCHGDGVKVITHVPHDQVPAYLNAMDILCAPSQTTPQWREQFGRMLIEAFACGVPVVASDSGEIPHVVGDAGIIVSEKSEPDWTDAIGTLIDDPARRRELAERGLERVHANYTWPVVAKKHLDFFEELLDATHRA
jgi:glycosyltransferase involved in cell wall biosynthesis